MLMSIGDIRIKCGGEIIIAVDVRALGSVIDASPERIENPHPDVTVVICSTGKHIDNFTGR